MLYRYTFNTKSNALYRYFPSSGGDHFFQFYGYNQYRDEFRWHQRMGGFATIEEYMKPLDEVEITEEEAERIQANLHIIQELSR